MYVNQSRCGTPADVTEYSLAYRADHMPVPSPTPTPGWNMKEKLAAKLKLLDDLLLHPPNCGATSREVFVNGTPAPTPAPGRIASNVVLAVGATSTIKLRYENEWGVQEIDSNQVHVTRQGDVDLDDDVDADDNLLMQNAIVGNQQPETPGFYGDISLAEAAYLTGAEYDGVLNVFDVLKHLHFIVGNVPCLTAPMTDQGPLRAAPAVQGMARLLVPTPKVAGKAGGLVSIPITLDVSGVTVGGQPLGVGGYLLRVAYDRQRATVSAVSPAPGSPFPEAPVFTDLAAANSSGVLRVVGALPLRAGALGVVPIAVIQIQERVAGAAAQVQIQVEQLASGLTDYGVLPISSSVSR